MAVAKRSRVEEVAALLDLMKLRGLTTLKVGDIELTMSPPVPDTDAEKKGRHYAPEEVEAKARAERRRIMLGAAGGIVPRASGE